MKTQGEQAGVGRNEEGQETKISTLAIRVELVSKDREVVESQGIVQKKIYRKTPIAISQVQEGAVGEVES